jgi:hypothetical protein
MPRAADVPPSVHHLPSPAPHNWAKHMLSRRQFKNEGRDQNSRLANGITMAARPQPSTDHRQAQRLWAQHGPDSASGEVRQKACYRGGTLAAGERVPADGGAEFQCSYGTDMEATNGVGRVDVQGGQV